MGQLSTLPDFSDFYKADRRWSMFGSKKNLAMSDQMETLIGPSTSIKGSLTSNGALRIDGQFEGDITTTADIIIGESGRVTATIDAKNAIVAGAVTGNMDIGDKLELMPTAKIIGDLKVGSLIIGEGAIFKGNCEMRQPTE
jgi:cytoskeletal protein CcmA (bactofilin family)